MHLAAVARVRRAAYADPADKAAAMRLKAWQSERLGRTYPDLLASARYRDAALFFLNELYGPLSQVVGRSLARIIHVTEDKRSLLWYKHVVETMFGAPKEGFSWLTIPQQSVCCFRNFSPSPWWRSLTSAMEAPMAERSC